MRHHPKRVSPKRVKANPNLNQRWSRKAAPTAWLRVSRKKLEVGNRARANPLWASWGVSPAESRQQRQARAGPKGARQARARISTSLTPVSLSASHPKCSALVVHAGAEKMLQKGFTRRITSVTTVPSSARLSSNLAGPDATNGILRSHRDVDAVPRTFHRLIGEMDKRGTSQGVPL